MILLAYPGRRMASVHISYNQPTVQDRKTLYFDTGVLEIEFDDGGKIIVNRHEASQEVWVAARAGGFHFRQQDGVWRDTRDQAELMERLAGLISGQAGERFSF